MVKQMPVRWHHEKGCEIIKGKIEIFLNCDFFAFYEKIFSSRKLEN